MVCQIRLSGWRSVSGHMDLWLLAAEKLSKVLISSILVSLYIRVKGHEVEQ